MAWKASELLVAGVVVAAIVWWRLPTGQDKPAEQPSATALRAGGATADPMPDVEASAQSLMMSVGGMIECRLEGILPMAAANKYGAHLKKLDPDRYQLGAQKAVYMLKGLALKPGSKSCKVVKAASCWPCRSREGGLFLRGWRASGTTVPAPLRDPAELISALEEPSRRICNTKMPSQRPASGRLRRGSPMYRPAA